MAFRDDDRAQAIQIGAVLLFAVLVIAFSLYQAFVVPNQNAQIEADHLQSVEGDMQNLRNGIVSVPKTGNGRSVRVSLGTNYPARAIALNPPPPSGRLRTVGTGDTAINVTIRNATALDRETADYWDGSEWNRSTGWISYEPDYAEFRDPPTLVYDSSTLHSQFDDASLWSTGQTLIDGRRITLATLDGSFDRGSSRSASVDLEAISASTTDVTVTGEDSPGNVTVEFASQRNASAWRSLLSEEGQLGGAGGYVHTVSGTSLADGYELISIEMEAGATYTLRMAKVGVGAGATGESAAYLTDIAGNGTTITRGESQEITLEVRDAYNNPVSGVAVNASLTPSDPGTLRTTQGTTDSAGRVSFIYESTASGRYEIRFSLRDIDGNYDRTGPQNVSADVLVEEPPRTGGGGTGGPFNVSWDDPRDIFANSGANITESGSKYIWNVGDSNDNSLQLNATTSPPYEGVSIDFAVNNSTVGSLSSEENVSDSSGIATTELWALTNGTVNVSATAGPSGDAITLHVVNATGQLSGPSGDRIQFIPGTQSTDWYSDVQFDIENVGSDSVTITQISVTSDNPNAEYLHEQNEWGAVPHGTEVYIDATDPGYIETGDGNSRSQNGLLLGDTETFDDFSTISGGEQATVTLYQFVENNGNSVGMSDSTISVTFTFDDGSTTTISFTA